MMRRMLGIVVLGVALMAGCGNGSEAPPADATSEPAPEPPRAYTAEELDAALPRSSQVPTASKKTGECPGGDDCEEGAASVSFELSRPGSAIEQERLATSAFTADGVLVTATALPDEAGAVAGVAESRGFVQRYDGDFDIALKSLSGTSYSPGEKGTGSVTDTTVEGWTGLEASRVQTYSSPDGPVAAPSQVTQLFLSDGNAQLAVFVSVLSAPRGEGGASQLARQLAADYIARLG